MWKPGIRRRKVNTEIRKLEDDIIALLNASDVPIEAKRLILCDVLDRKSVV